MRAFVQLNGCTQLRALSPTATVKPVSSFNHVMFPRGSTGTRVIVPVNTKLGALRLQVL